MKKAVVLLSGGMDSLVSLATAIKEKYKIIALHSNYGQVTQNKEEQAFNALLEYYNIQDKMLVSLDYLKQIGGSSLTDESISREETDTTIIPKSYVPIRNGNLLMLAASLAEIKEAEAIYIGVTQADYSGYPDCRGEFLEVMQQAINLGTATTQHITIKAPLLNMTKADIVRRGLELGVPFEKSWSCYYSNVLACGVCPSCQLRIKGFKENGIEDPIKYK